MVVHGLNAVYLKEYNRWLRIDARGNKEGVNAQFNIYEEKIAWQANPSIGEADHSIIFHNPHKTVLRAMRENSTRQELYNNLYVIVQSVFDNDLLKT